MDWSVSSITIYLVVAVVTLVCIRIYRRFTLLRRCGLKGPTPWPIVGNLVEQFSKGFVETQAEWDLKYGKIYGYYNGYRPHVMVREPVLVKKILIKDFTTFMDRPPSRSLPKLFRDGLFFMEGRKWKKTRNILTPTFSAGKLKQISYDYGQFCC